ncbi:MAG: hypothetical protein KDA32_14355, partial [Phycisphaerales bacterium]|nr:hypothetical protein [Phycisphaerales bacterium]
MTPSESSNAGRMIAERRWREAIRKLLADMPEDYDARREAMVRLRDVFHQEIAASIEPGLNAYAAEQPQSDLASCRKLAADVNRHLRELGLTLASPDNSGPAILLADFQDAQHKESLRFRLQITDETGRRFRRLASAKLPALRPVPVPVRTDPAPGPSRNR